MGGAISRENTAVKKKEKDRWGMWINVVLQDNYRRDSQGGCFPIHFLG